MNRPGFSFFKQSAPTVAKHLLGMHLIHHLSQGTISGRIVETEAYNGPADLASHAARKKPGKARILFGSPGVIYVYKVYGLHFCLNVVTGPESQAGAVLIRAVEPLKGLDIMRSFRGIHITDRNLARGPGNLTRAFNINNSLNGLCIDESSLEILYTPASIEIARGPRVGVDYASECAEWPWRFWIKDSPHVSKS